MFEDKWDKLNISPKPRGYFCNYRIKKTTICKKVKKKKKKKKKKLCIKLKYKKWSFTTNTP